MAGAEVTMLVCDDRVWIDVESVTDLLRDMEGQAEFAAMDPDRRVAGNAISTAVQQLRDHLTVAGWSAREQIETRHTPG